MSLPQEKQFISMALNFVWSREVVARKFEIKLACFIPFQEAGKVFFSDSINPANFYAFYFFIFDELKHGQVMQLQILSDLFGCHESRTHIHYILLNLDIL